ncbi:uncharacterized protein LOC121718821 isoform X25 [Alosa sapidissima]|uniref:uncharacterized protein LOC121718821 isoform X25 n=1 Tax=Alosa sapidissima TaxID=34773 RepID=UPI001C0A0BBA|nr:uncharacterized protein LOC121718821 isoform X25 [Alosa sapidissima]
MQGSTSRRQPWSASNHTDSGRLRRVGTKINEVSQHMDMSHKQACIDLEKATQIITQALQHEVGRNQELCMLIRRLEEKEAETGRSLTEQVESNKQLKRKIDELQKHLEEKHNSLTQANQTVAFLKNELRDLHQHLQTQQNNRTVQEVNKWPQDGESQIKQIKSPSPPVQSDQLTAAEEPLVWSEQLVSPEVQSVLRSSDGQMPLVSPDGRIPLISGIKEENAVHGYEECSQYERADCRVEYTVPSDADIKFEQIQTPVSSDGQRLLEAPVSEDEDGDDDEYGEYSNSERADPRTEYTVPSAADIQFKQIQMPLSSKEKSARFHAKIRADPAARAEWLAKRRERYQQRKQAGQSSHQRVNYYQTIKELTASEAANRREQWRLYQRRCRERQRVYTRDDVERDRGRWKL